MAENISTLYSSLNSGPNWDLTTLIVLDAMGLKSVFATLLQPTLTWVNLSRLWVLGTHPSMIMNQIMEGFSAPHNIHLSNKWPLIIILCVCVCVCVCVCIYVCVCKCLHVGVSKCLLTLHPFLFRFRRGITRDFKRNHLNFSFFKTSSIFNRNFFIIILGKLSISSEFVYHWRYIEYRAEGDSKLFSGKLKYVKRATKKDFLQPI